MVSTSVELELRKREFSTMLPRLVSEAKVRSPSCPDALANLTRASSQLMEMCLGSVADMEAATGHSVSSPYVYVDRVKLRFVGAKQFPIVDRR